METIVSSGTRLNIGYYLDEAMDPEKQEEMIEYFRESDSVDAALKERALMIIPKRRYA